MPRMVRLPAQEGTAQHATEKTVALVMPVNSAPKLVKKPDRHASMHCCDKSPRRLPLNQQGKVETDQRAGERHDRKLVRNDR